MRERRTTPECITKLEPNEIFVFGSNLSGMHGGGAAYVAYRKFGAIMGQGWRTSCCHRTGNEVCAYNVSDKG